MGGGGKGGSDKEAQRQRQEEQLRQERVRQGTASINSTFDDQFTDDWFGERAQAYTTYAMPQLDQQFQDAQQKLAYALARGNTGNSSVRATKEAELQDLYDTHARSIADQSQAQADQTRTAVEDARGNLIATLNTTGDAEAAANQALARAQALSQPEAFSPLEQLFVDFTNGLGTQAALERSASYEGSPVKSRYNTGLFGVRPGAVSNA